MRYHADYYRLEWGKKMPDSLKDELARRIAEYPEDALAFFKRGLSTVSRVPDQDRKLILQRVTDRFGSFRRFALGAVLSQIGALSRREVDEVGYVYSVVIGLLLEYGVTTQDFMEAARGLLFAPEQEATFRACPQLGLGPR
jgi:hypothetical protein